MLIYSLKNIFNLFIILDGLRLQQSKTSVGFYEWPTEKAVYWAE